MHPRQAAETEERDLKAIGALHRVAIEISNRAASQCDGRSAAVTFAVQAWQVLTSRLGALTGGVVHLLPNGTTQALMHGCNDQMALDLLLAWKPKAGIECDAHYDPQAHIVTILCQHNGLFINCGRTAWILHLPEGTAMSAQRTATLAGHLSLSGTAALRASRHVQPNRQQISATLWPFAARAAQGETNDQIASALGVSTATVARRLGIVYQRLGVSSRHQLNPSTFSKPPSAPRFSKLHAVERRHEQ